MKNKIKTFFIYFMLSIPILGSDCPPSDETLDLFISILEALRDGEGEIKVGDLITINLGEKNAAESDKMASKHSMKGTVNYIGSQIVEVGLMSFEVSSLDVGEEEEKSFNVTFNQPGTYEIIGLADSNDDIKEDDEKNNGSTKNEATNNKVAKSVVLVVDGEFNAKLKINEYVTITKND